MIIKRIMLVAAIAILVAGLTLAGIRIYQHWNTCKWILLVIGIVGFFFNTAIWIVLNMDGIYKGDKYYLWHCINLTIYTAGLYWLGYGIYKLWDHAEEIEHSIEVAFVRYRNAKEDKKASKGALAISDSQLDIGALTITKTQSGELSLK